MKDEEVDAGDEDLGQRAEGSREHRASLLHAVSEQQVPHAGRHYTLKHTSQHSLRQRLNSFSLRISTNNSNTAAMQATGDDR
jgi:hypothetical protein